MKKIIVNNKPTSDISFGYGAYVDHTASEPELRYGAKPGVIVIRKGELNLSNGYDGFDNNGGGVWTHYIEIPILTPPDDYVQYLIEITPDSINVRSNDLTSVLATGSAALFWSNVKTTNDIRVFDQNLNQNHFWIEEFDFQNKIARIWVKLNPSQTKVGIAFGNPNASESGFNNGENTFEFFDDFNINNGWTITGSRYNIGDSLLFANQYRCTDPAKQGAYIEVPFLSNTNYAVDAKLYVVYKNDVVGPTVLSTTDTSSILANSLGLGRETATFTRFYIRTNQKDFVGTTQIGRSSIEQVEFGVTWSDNQWNRLSIVKRGSTVRYVWELNGARYYQDTTTVDVGTTQKYLIVCDGDWSTDIYANDLAVDYVIVRQCISSDLQFDVPTIKEF